MVYNKNEFQITKPTTRIKCISDFKNDTKIAIRQALKEDWSL